MITFLWFRAEIALTDGRLMSITRELNTTEEEDGSLRRTLSVLERELRDINTTVAEKKELLEQYHSAGFNGENTKYKIQEWSNRLYVGLSWSLEGRKSKTSPYNWLVEFTKDKNPTKKP